MRYLFVPVAFALLAGVTPYMPADAASKSTTAGNQATSSENCGTPDQFKPCPPLPRKPLQKYPANKKS